MPGGEPLRLLILEDRASDAELMVAELARAGFAPEWERVDTAAGFLAALANAPDLVLADYQLPQFDGAHALSVLLSQAPDVPLILLSGEVSTAVAIECMQRGAADYLPKREVERLGPAVRRALERRYLRAEQHQNAERIGQLNRMLYALRSVHRVVAREGDIPTLLGATCSILERTEGFGAAWIGRVSEDGTRLVPAAGNLDVAARMAATDSGVVDPWGGCPTNKACITRRAALCGDLGADPACGDLGTDPACADTLEAVGELGFTAVAAVPIRHDENLLGALTIFGTRPDVLTGEVLALLGDLGADLGRAIHAIEAEEALRASEERFRRLFETMAQGVIYQLDDGRIVEANPAAQRMFGLTHDQFLGRTSSDPRWGVILPDGTPLPPPEHPSMVALRTGRPVRDFLCGVFHPLEGTHRWLILDAVPEFHPGEARPYGVFITTTDVTDRKLAEDELRQREYWLQQAQRVGRAGYYVLNVAAGTWSSSAELDLVFGIDATFERSVAGWAGLVHPEERDAMAQYFREEVIGRRLPFDRKYRIVRPSDGAMRWVWGRGELALDAAGNPVRMFGTIQDVTERHDAEEALRESERKYRTLVEGLPIGIYRTSPEGRILAANRAWLDLMGYDSEEQLQQLRMARDVCADPAERPGLVEAVGAARGGTVFETRWKRRDGTPIDVRVTTRPVRDADGTAIAFESAVQDVSRSRILEEQLRQAQKIEAVGQLAGGVAHDFNNLLTTIVTSADLLSDLAPAGSEAAEDIAAIKHAAERGAELTKKLLAFGRKQRLELRTVDLNVLARDFTKLARRLVREDVEIVTHFEPEPLTVHVDPTAVDQILMNLITNARDAMPGGGVLGIQTGRMTLDEEFCATHGRGAPGAFALLSVSDTGKGMDAPTLRHLFEPFFTTKPVGEGTGLGTAMIYGLVQEHRGHIHVESESGHGTTVRVLLPLAQRGEETPVPPGAGVPLDGTEAILLADDEEQLRAAAKRLLERHGYTVYLASDGADALGVYLAREREIAVIVSDVVMPRMSGPELRAELRRRGKAPRILFTSGYTARDAMQAKHLGEGTRFIPKPWTAAGLLGAVREALDGEPEP